MKKLLLICLVLGGTAFADQVNCIKWKDADGVTVGTYCKPFTVKAGSNITFTDDQLTRVMTIDVGNPSYVSVLSHGALHDGSDDYQAIHEAALASITAKQCLYFPAGTYVLGTAITDAVYCIIGDGVHQSILTVSGASSTNKLVDISAAPDGFKMTGLQFAGPGQSASGGQIGVKVANSGGNVSDAIFEDLYFSGWPNYCLDLEAPIVTTVRNVRCLQSMRGIYYNGGTSVTTVGSYMNQIKMAGYDMKGTDYSAFISNACDTCGMAYLLRNASIGDAFIGNGHEAGTARTVTVTNVALTTNVATVTYTGGDLSADWVSGMTLVVDGTTSTAGLFNVRAVPTSVTSSTIVYPLTHADVGSAADTGTACLFCGDGIVVNNSTGTQIFGFYGTSAQQLTSNHITISGTSANTMLSGVVSDLGGSGTPLTQTIDVYLGASTSNTFRLNANLIGGITNNGSQTQTYSSAGTWTIGNIAHNSGTTASAGFLRLNKTDALNFRNNANGADITGLTLDTSDVVQVGSSGMKTAGATPTVSASQLGFGTTTGFGVGAAGTAITTTTKGAGTGPTTPQTIVNHLKINIGGTDYYIPLVQ